jgi:hypothetical protein
LGATTSAKGDPWRYRNNHREYGSQNFGSTVEILIEDENPTHADVFGRNGIVTSPVQIASRKELLVHLLTDRAWWLAFDLDKFEGQVACAVCRFPGGTSVRYQRLTDGRRPATLYM